MKNWEVLAEAKTIQIAEVVKHSRLFIALSRFLAHDFRETIHECSECISDPNTSLEAEYAAFCLRGWAHYLVDDARTAVDDFSIWINGASARDGDDVDVTSGYKFRAACYERLEEWELALSDLQSAIDQIGARATEVVELLYRRATVQAELQRVPAAISDYQKVIDLDPAHDRAAEHLALLKRDAIKEAAALRETERSTVGIAAETGVLTWQSALDKLAENDIPSAIEICEKILANRPESRDTHFVMGLSKDLRGRNQRKRGNTAEAEKDFEQAIESYSTLLTEKFDSPFATRAFDRRGQLRLAMGSPESLNAAVDDFSTVIEREQSLAAYLHRGFTYFELARYPEAIDDLNEVLDRNSKNSLALELYGMIALLKLDTAAAKEIFEAARPYCEDTRREAHVELMQGAVEYLEENYQKAVEHLRTAEALIRKLQAWELGELQRKMRLLKGVLPPPEVSGSKIAAVGESKQGIGRLKEECDAILNWIFGASETPVLA